MGKRTMKAVLSFFEHPTNVLNVRCIAGSMKYGVFITGRNCRYAVDVSGDAHRIGQLGLLSRRATDRVLRGGLVHLQPILRTLGDKTSCNKLRPTAPAISSY